MSKRMGLIGVVLFLILIVSIWNNNSEGFGATIDTTKETFKVVIDPGHGGKDVGSTGASGLYEKDFTLSLAKKVKEVMGEEKIEVYLIREDDTFIPQKDMHRPEFIKELDADLYIAIHGNAYESANISGTETYYYHNKFKAFAKIMHKNVVGSTVFKDRGVRKKDLFVMRNTDIPSVLLEIGYLTNPQEEQIMFTDEFQYSVAKAICAGVKEYLETSWFRGNSFFGFI